jgi:hypothetical protein
MIATSGNGVPELAQLPVALLDAVDVSSREEAVAQEADGPLDPPLGKSSRLHRIRRMRGRASG